MYIELSIQRSCYQWLNVKPNPQVFTYLQNYVVSRTLKGTLRFYDAPICDASIFAKRLGRGASAGMIKNTLRFVSFYANVRFKMSSFKKARDALLIAYDDSLVDDEEFVALYDVCRSKNPELPYYEYPSFALEEMDEAECAIDFRFKRKEIPFLARVLDFPDKFTCQHGTVCEGVEALCMVLRRFSYPCRYSDMLPQFGSPIPEFSMITNTVVDYIYQKHGEKITRWNNKLLSPGSLRLYADTVHRKGAALENCFGFVDATVRQICQPDQM